MKIRVRLAKMSGVVKNTTVLAVAMTVMMGISLGVGTKVYALPEGDDSSGSSLGLEDECVDAGGAKTAILGSGGCFRPDSAGGETAGGGMVIKLLTDIVDILTVGVGILGVIGITVVGLQYLTAGGSEEKTRAAKRRMFEIVIGLIAYVLIYAVLKWLLPTFGQM